VYSQLLDERNEVFYSQVSLWEISIKYNLGKIALQNINPEELYYEIEKNFLQCKTLLNKELATFYTLPIEHKDPFDRLLPGQCIRSDLVFATVDGEAKKYIKYGLKTLS